MNIGESALVFNVIKRRPFRDTFLTIFSMLFSISFISVPSAKAWSSAQTAVSVFGGVGNEFSESTVVDSTGNIYTTGRFASTVDFDPGVGTSNLTSAGSSDVFVSKLDASGNLLWAKSFGAAAADAGLSIAVDSTGNVYTTGFFASTVDFDPGAGTTNLTTAGSSDVFISKLDASGNLVFAKRFGGGISDLGYSIAVDSTGNIYTTGFFQDTVDFDPSAGTTNLTTAGLSDVFISKLDASGNLVFAKRFGGSISDLSYSIAVDSTGNIYTTGFFQDTVDFDPSAGTTNLTTAGLSDVFISKLDASGNLVFAKRFGAAEADAGRSIALDSTGNIYTAGYFEQTVDFDPSAGTTNLTSAGRSDVFVSKLDSSGNLVFAKRFGAAETDVGLSVAVDSTGNVYTTGYFEQTVDFDPGAGTTDLTTGGGSDVFVSKLDASGNLVFAKRFGGSNDDGGISISVDSNGNIHTTGYFEERVDFDPGAGTSNLTSAGGTDVFVSKIDSSGNLLLAKSFGGTANDVGRSITFDSTGNIYTTGEFAGTVDFDPGTGTTNLISAGGNDVFILRLDPSGDARASAAPSAPTLNSITGGDRRVTITFTAGANNGAAITDYEYSLNGASYISAGTTSSPLTITGLSGRTAYSVTFKARNSVGLSTASNSLSATTSDASLDASEAAVEAARLAAIELARGSAASEAARKAKEQRELTEILALIPKIGELTLSLGENTKSLYSTKCVKGKTTKFVKKGNKCPKGYLKK